MTESLCSLSSTLSLYLVKLCPLIEFIELALVSGEISSIPQVDGQNAARSELKMANTINVNDQSIFFNSENQV